MPPFTELEPLLAHLSRAVLAHEEAQDALSAAAQRAAGAPGAPGSSAALRALARCEVLERRARLHVELARQAVARRRSQLLDDQRRVPAAFRKRNSRSNPSVEVLGAPAQRTTARPSGNGTARHAARESLTPTR